MSHTKDSQDIQDKKDMNSAEKQRKCVDFSSNPAASTISFDNTEPVDTLLINPNHASSLTAEIVVSRRERKCKKAKPETKGDRADQQESDDRGNGFGNPAQGLPMRTETCRQKPEKAEKKTKKNKNKEKLSDGSTMDSAEDSEKQLEESEACSLDYENLSDKTVRGKGKKTEKIGLKKKASKLFGSKITTFGTSLNPKKAGKEHRTAALGWSSLDALSLGLSNNTTVPSNSGSADFSSNCQLHDLSSSSSSSCKAESKKLTTSSSCSSLPRETSPLLTCQPPSLPVQPPPSPPLPQFRTTPPRDRENPNLQIEVSPWRHRWHHDTPIQGMLYALVPHLDSHKCDDPEIQGRLFEGHLNGFEARIESGELVTQKLKEERDMLYGFINNILGDDEEDGEHEKEKNKEKPDEGSEENSKYASSMQSKRVKGKGAWDDFVNGEITDEYIPPETVVPRDLKTGMELWAQENGRIDEWQLWEIQDGVNRAGREWWMHDETDRQVKFEKKREKRERRERRRERAAMKEDLMFGKLAEKANKEKDKSSKENKEGIYISASSPPNGTDFSDDTAEEDEPVDRFWSGFKQIRKKYSFNSSAGTDASRFWVFANDDEDDD